LNSMRFMGAPKEQSRGLRDAHGSGESAQRTAKAPQSGHWRHAHPVMFESNINRR
jgi:hypothetical protein